MSTHIDKNTIDSNLEDLISYSDLRMFLVKKIGQSNRDKMNYLSLLKILDLSACHVNNQGDLSQDEIKSAIYSELS